MTKLDDASAIHILRTIAQARLARGVAPELGDNPPLRAALGEVFEVTSATATSEGDLARAALAVLAQDAAYAEPIQTMAAAGPATPPRYIDAASIAVVTAALLVLQTRIKFKFDSSGKWSVEGDRKPASDGLLKVLAERLMPFLKG